jgi:hypothetical protein
MRYTAVRTASALTTRNEYKGRDRSREKKRASSLKNMAMLALSKTILLRGMRAREWRPLEVRKARKGCDVYPSSIRTKNFKSLAELSVNHGSEILINSDKFRATMHKRKPCKTRKVINEQNIISISTF